MNMNYSPEMQSNTMTMTGCPAKRSVCWSAVAFGTLATIGVTIVIFVLGSGIGLTGNGLTTETETAVSFTIKSGLWLIIMQWLASAMGGYLAGRLRSQPSSLHADETYFRDSAHGFMVWTIATILMVFLFASTTAGIIKGSTHAATTMAAAYTVSPTSKLDSGKSDLSLNPLDTSRRYIVGNLFRGATMNPDLEKSENEATQIFIHGLKNSQLNEEDKAYLVHLVSNHTGLNAQQANARLENAIGEINNAKAQAVQYAEQAKKAASHVAIFTALSLIIGAFIASVAGILGGHHRDEV